MAASPNEIDRIAEVCLDYLPEEDFEELAQELWEEVGQRTDNESLRATLLALRDKAKLVL